MIDIRTGKEMTRRDFGKGIAAILSAGVAPSIAMGLVGSANASVGRGMMRNVGARQVAMFGSDIPYERVSYLEANRGPYIDLCVKNTSGLFIRAKVAFLGGYTSQHVFGARIRFLYNHLGVSVQYGETDNVSTRYAHGNECVEYDWQQSPVSDRFRSIESTSVSFKEDDLPVLTFNTSQYSTNLNLFLFALNNNGTPHEQLGYCRYSEFQLYNSTGLIRDMIPVIDGGVGYMFDKCGSICPLTGTPLYANAGTGAFTWG